MFSPTFKENVQEWKHPGSCTFAEPELFSYIRPKRVIQNEKNGHKNPNNSHNYHDENHDEIELDIKEIIINVWDTVSTFIHLPRLFLSAGILFEQRIW